VGRFAWIAGLALLFASRALAQTALPLELEWHAPTECPSANAVRAELSRIANVRSGLTLRPLVARIQVIRRANTYTAALHTEHEGRSGQRQLEATNCRTLVRSVTLVLALAFGAGVEVSESAAAEARSVRAEGPTRSANPRPPPAAASNADASNPDASDADSSHADPSDAESLDAESPGADASDTESPDLDSSNSDNPTSEDAHLNLWLGAGVQFALLPSAAFTAGLGLELESHRFSLGVRVLLWPGATRELRSDAEAHFAALGAAFRGCALVPLDRLKLAACAGVHAVAVRGNIDDTPGVRGDSAIAPWYALSLGVGLDWPRAAPLRVRIEANLALALNRARFDIEGSGSAYRVARWSPLLAAGLVFAP
jgi:hypothetical protein